MCLHLAGLVWNLPSVIYSGAVALLDWLIWATADAAIPTFVLILLQILVHFPGNVDSTDQSNLSR